MKDKEKLIEQILEKVGVYNGSDMGGKTFVVRPQYLEREILKHYQPKLPKDSVVLSREEYEKLKSLYGCEQGSYMTSQIGNLPLTIEGLRKAVDEITRLIGVQTELQELNIKYYNEAKDLRRKHQNLQAHAKINDEYLHIRIKEQARKETAKEIYERLIELSENPCNDREEIYKEVFGRYGVEVEE